MGQEMKKKLSDMTLEELWQLFPIQLTAHNEIWQDYYEKMKKSVEQALSDCSIVRISHIGSTAINGIWAKPIVDILVEIEENEDIKKAAAFIQSIGFIPMSTGPNRISLNLGYTEKGFAEKVYHLHIRRKGDNDELYFRDYLNEFPETAKLYEQLKLSLWKQYEHNRDRYTNAKTKFVNKYTEEAKAKYLDRYN